MKTILSTILFLIAFLPVAAQTTVVSTFRNDTEIGMPHKNRIELIHYHTTDHDYVVLRFFSKKGREWTLRNKFQFEKDALLPCNPELIDFNNDGLKDLTYRSAAAARSANDVRKLFIYDKKNDRLIYVKNAEDFPNLRYNKTLKCIDAFLVYGGCMTVFLQLEGNLLKKFASVELDNGLTVRLYSKQNSEKVIFSDTANKAGFVRYKNYRPLEEAEDY